MGIRDLNNVLVGASPASIYGGLQNKPQELVYVGEEGIYTNRIITQVNGKKVEISWDQNGLFTLASKGLFNKEKVYLKIQGKPNESAKGAFGFNQGDKDFSKYVNEVYRVYNALKNIQKGGKITDERGDSAYNAYIIINGVKYIACEAIYDNFESRYIDGFGKWKYMGEQGYESSVVCFTGKDCKKKVLFDASSKHVLFVKTAYMDNKRRSIESSRSGRSKKSASNYKIKQGDPYIEMCGGQLVRWKKGGKKWIPYVSCRMTNMSYDRIIEPSEIEKVPIYRCEKDGEWYYSVPSIAGNNEFPIKDKLWDNETIDSFKKLYK